ncbi:MAG: hypothetical protein H8M99_06655 [Gloeobacteraceae cyanobacterium ES-bin-144]|nr:hypothetical protein [Verrucomicrobiales bacterium]
MAFRGPDAERFLNGQITQDVRLLAGGENSLPSCVTDAKGRLQFRVWITAGDDGTLWVECPLELAGSLEARLTRYLIADDVEVTDISGQWSLVHFTGETPDVPEAVMSRKCSRFRVAGTDWWIPAGQEVAFPGDLPLMQGDAFEAWRISMGIPLWGNDLIEGLLLPEAGLDATDVSYHKGCYIGQEVISRMKFAGKVNKRLRRVMLEKSFNPGNKQLLDQDGNAAGNLTSVSPLLAQNGRPAMAYMKRGIERFFATGTDGELHLVSVLSDFPQTS